MNRRGFMTLCLGMLFAALVLVSGFVGCTTNTAQTNTRDVSTAIDLSTLKPAIVLFNPDGSYAVHKYNIVKGAKFSFFGYDWRVVNVKDNIATFWMDSPFATSKFQVSKESGVIQTADRTWNNGYFGATWKSYSTAQVQQLGTSTIRLFLLDAESIVIGTKAGADKVIAGPLEGINQSNQTATMTAYDIYYRREKLTNVKPITKGQSITIDYSIGSGDKLWLPSYQEIKDGGIWGLNAADRNWDTTTVSQCAWLRTPFYGNKEHPANNCDALAVGYSSQIRNSKDFESVYYDHVDQEYGVRPAIHLNTQSASPGGDTAAASVVSKEGSETSTFDPADSGVYSVPDVAKMAFPPIFEIGGIGPAGGIIFYDKGRYSDGWRYLEAAPADLGKAQWKSAVSQLCQQYSQGGYRDWFLPGNSELDLMYNNLKMKSLGDFSDGEYWSSSQSSFFNAWNQRFSDGLKSKSSKSAIYSVRACRRM